MDKEKFGMVTSYFDEIGVKIPTSVRNAIEDVFMENDDIGSVECYHAEDVEQFQTDLKLKNDVEMVIRR